MPELPEVETTRSGIAPYVEKNTLQSVTVRFDHLRWPIPVAQLESLQGKTLNKVLRRAKYIQLMFDDAYVLVHLGMSGSLRMVKAEAALKKHDHVDFIFDNEWILRFNDPRRFGCILYQDGHGQHALLENLGPEPLLSEFDGEYLFKRSRKKTQAIKSFIMDSHIVVGVGNIYAAEALFMAGIHPNKAAGKVSKQSYQRLAEFIKLVLANAIKQGGTTLRDYVNSEGKPGYFSQQLLVYGRQNEPCTRCGSLIKVSKLAQRSTFYCAECQK